MYQRIISKVKYGDGPYLLYPEGILFPSIHFNTILYGCSIIGCIPDPLLTESIIKSVFASIQSHIWSRLTNRFLSKSINFRYCIHWYDMLTNISDNHEDTWLIINHGLMVFGDKLGGLCVRGTGYPALLELVENKQIVRNLRFPQKYA